MTLKKMDIYLFPVDNVHCGFGIQQGVVLPSLPWIPGQVVRGALAGWAVRNGLVNGSDDGLFKQLFLPEWNDSTVSFPFLTYKGWKPAPLSLFAPKGSSAHPFERLYAGEPLRWMHQGQNIDGSMGNPMDFLCRDKWPSETDMNLKPASGLMDNRIFHSPLAMVLDMRAAHDPGNEKVGTAPDDAMKAGGIRVEESLPATSMGRPQETWYGGELIFDDSNGETEKLFSGLTVKQMAPHNIQNLNPKLLQNLLSSHRVHIGRKRVAAIMVAGGCKDVESSSVPGKNGKVSSETMTFTLSSPLLIPEKYVSNNNGISPGKLFRDILKDKLQLGDPTYKRAFCRLTEIHGYDTSKSGRDGRKAPSPALAAGSAVCLEIPQDIDINAEKLNYDAMPGIGPGTRDGYGRVIVNWDVHSLDA